MAGKNTAVFGIYRDRVGVERAVDDLKDAGFRNTDISVLFPDNVGTKDLLTRRLPRLPKEQQLVQARELLLEARSAGWNRLTGDSRSWPADRRRPDRGGADRGRRWRRAGRHHRSPGGHGHSRI
jgi:hypothetical protein